MKWTTAFVVGVLALAAVPAGAKVIYVDGSAADSNNGSSWVKAYNCLQDALADANTADKPVEIRVAQGTYTPDRGRGIEKGDRDAAFRLVGGVTLMGGYAGLGGTDPNERDPAKYVSLLSGDLDGDDVPVLNPKQLLDDSTHLDNSRRVLKISAGDSNETGALVSGFAVASAHNNIESGDMTSEGGAGIFIQSGIVSIVDCNVSDNSTCSVGGGVYARAGCRLTMVNCVVTGNYGEYGGGISTGLLYAFSDGCRLVMTGCTFNRNSALQGGGMFIYGGQVEASDCTFNGNSADGMDNAAFGGGMYLLGVDLVLTRCSFTGNTAFRAGGAFSQATGKAQVIGCTFSRNGASVGGAVDLSGSNALFDGCSFTGNNAPSGGGLYCMSCPVTLKHCLFAGNGSEQTSKRPFGERREGGAVYLIGRASVANCTFHGNRAQRGTSLWVSLSDVTMANCILWDGGGQVYTDEGARPTITYSDVMGTWPDTGNIAVDPNFVQPGHWDPNGTPDKTRDDFWVDGDYHLKSQSGHWNAKTQEWVLDNVTSPCIDAGDPNCPVADECDPNGGRINLGAYGGTKEASKS